MATFKTLNNRKGRAEVAKETVEIIERGFYTIALDSDDATKVEFGQDIRDSVESSQVYLPIDLEHIRRRGRTWNVGDLEVTSENSISACKRIVTEGRTCCLNFASAKNVCGGMMKGSLAQEESLGLCSAISATQKKFLKEYYGSNRRDPKEGYYSDTLIYSPAVPVFRDDEDLALIDNPYKVDFISCPAVNKGRALKAKSNLEPIDQVMLRRIENVLSVAEENGADLLVLGAWGTGVFGNEAKDIAKLFKTCLSSSMCTTGSHQDFKKVVFAIGKDDSKKDIFTDVLLSN